MSQKRLELVRGLGTWSAAAIVAGTMIGTGIFLVPGGMARSAGSEDLVLMAWIVGGALSLFGASSYAELSAAIPEAGGDYEYLKRGFNPAMGFLFGWMHTMVGRPASQAAIAAGLLRFWSFLMPAAALPLFTWHLTMPFREKPSEFTFTAAQPLAAAVIVLVTLINCLGVRFGGRIQVMLTLIKVAAIATMVGLGLAVARGRPVHFQPFWRLEPGALGGFLTALVAALWAYDGWANLALVGSEVNHPHRSIPLALVGGVVFVTAVYLAVNAVYFYVLPFAQVAQSQHVASDVVERFAGPGVARWITLALLLSALGTLNSSILSGARVPYAMARDGIFFRLAAIVHPRFRTPTGALVLQGSMAATLALTGTFEELFSLFILAAWIFYGLTIASLFRLRRNLPDLPRPYKTWGYPWTPLLFLAGALAVTLNVWREQPLRSSIGLALILSGLVFYRRWSSSSPAGEPDGTNRRLPSATTPTPRCTLKQNAEKRF